MAKAWITLKRALKLDPGFLEKRKGKEWEYDPKRDGFYSLYGFAQYRVQVDKNGMPDFGRVVYGEAENINVPVWGVDKDGVPRVLIVFQERPFADQPNGKPSSPPIVFGQPCVLAFNIDRAESIIATVLRELLEEGGVPPEALIGKPVKMGVHAPAPTFCATWSNLFEVKVDLSKVILPTDTEERITGTAWLPVREVISRIGKGKHDGINYRYATANGAFFVWLARHPELLAA